jgi:hypothetical protein
VNSKQADRESEKASILVCSVRISDFAYWLQPEQLSKKEGLLGDSSPNKRRHEELILCVWAQWCGQRNLNRRSGFDFVCVRAPSMKTQSVLVGVSLTGFLPIIVSVCLLFVLVS